MVWGCQAGVKPANLTTHECYNRSQSYRNLRNRTFLRLQIRRRHLPKSLLGKALAYALGQSRC